MPKKVSVKKTKKKVPVKRVAKAMTKKAMKAEALPRQQTAAVAPETILGAETPSLAEVTKEETHEEHLAENPVHEEHEESISMETKEVKTEDSTMGQEKGIGKEYNPSEFSQPATSADGAHSNKIYWYVGGAVGVVALLIVGLFFMGGFGMSKDLAGQSTLVTAYCSDTDGGYNRFTKGVADGTYYLGYEVGQYMDECAAGEDNKLTEYYCKNDLIVYATEPCPAGMTCQDGICA